MNKDRTLVVLTVMCIYDKCHPTLHLFVIANICLQVSFLCEDLFRQASTSTQRQCLCPVSSAKALCQQQMLAFNRDTFFLFFLNEIIEYNRNYYTFEKIAIMSKL